MRMDLLFEWALVGHFRRYRYIHETDTFLNTNQIHAVEAPNMRLEWPVYAFTAGVFLAFALEHPLYSSIVS